VRRGFKAESERIADQMRSELHVPATEALRSQALAAHLGLEVRSAGDLIDVSKLQALEQLQPGAFSACTFEIGDRRIIVWNPLSSPARTQSDIAHEAAHVLLRHEVKRVERVGSFTFFSCDPDEEQEANWLAGSLLLPRSLLMRLVRTGTDVDHFAARLGLSREMVNYRLRATGVLRQTTRGALT
jgi:Zn-dependent peptidase ImmA (M78 family)